jgi:hypothetical protein
MASLAVEALHSSPLTACTGVVAAVKAKKAAVRSFQFKDAAIHILDSRAGCGGYEPVLQFPRSPENCYFSLVNVFFTGLHILVVFRIGEKIITDGVI